MVLCLVRPVPRRALLVLFALVRSAVSLRALAAVLVTALLLAHASNALHELLVPHRVCAEHGHRVHANEAPEGAALGTPRVRGPAASPERAAEPVHHEHCAPPARPEGATAPPLRTKIATLAPIVGKAPAATARLAVRAGPSILLIAPKQSPPV
jgi:hypothetical protein